MLVLEIIQAKINVNTWKQFVGEIRQLIVTGPELLF